MRSVSVPHGVEVMPNAPCKICGNDADYTPDNFFPGYRCPRCGDFDFDRTVGWVEMKIPDEIVRLSGWVREQNAAGIRTVRITPNLARRAIRSRLPSLRDRADKALALVYERFRRPENWFVPDVLTHDLELQGRSYSTDDLDAMLLLSILEEDGNLRSGGAGCSLSIRGILRVEALGIGSSNSAQGFVAMSFDKSMDDSWLNGFDPAIRAAGFSPLRIDNKDYVGGITDEMIAEIRRSRFLVADYTGQRNGVYFEAGFALGLGLIVIPTCREDEISKLHFDIKHLNTLTWKTPTNLAEDLTRRIRAVVGIGPKAE
jgi:hypothetical protein